MRRTAVKVKTFVLGGCLAAIGLLVGTANVLAGAPADDTPNERETISSAVNPYVAHTGQDSELPDMVVGIGGGDVDSPDVPDDCPPDISGDGTVDIGDVIMVFDNWGPCEMSVSDICPADRNGDAHVDVLDLIDVIMNWGNCP